MKKPVLDKNILKAEIDRLCFAMESGRGRAQVFNEQAFAMNALLQDFKKTFEPAPGRTVVDALNAALCTMKDKMFEEGGNGFKNTEDYVRYLEVTEREYGQETAHGRFGRDEAARAAKKALHDYMDAACLHRIVFGESREKNISPELVTAFRDKAQALLKQPLQVVRTSEPVLVK